MKAKIIIRIIRIIHFLGCLFLILVFVVGSLTVNHWVEKLLPWTVQ